MELKILSAFCSDREAYEKAKLHCKDVFSDRGKLVFQEIDNFYGIDKEVGRVDTDILRDRLIAKYPKHTSMWESMIGSLDPSVSVDNVLVEVYAFKRRQVKDKLASAFTREDNEDTIEELLEEYEKYNITEAKENSGDTTTFHNSSATDIIVRSTSSCLIRVSPESFNTACGGGLLRKHHVLIFARPDCGKTAFAINLVGCFLGQGLKVLYLSNEDAPEEIVLRTMTRLTLLDTNAIIAHPEKADAILQERNWKNFVFVEMCPGTPAEIRGLVMEYRPDVLIVDQSRNVSMGKDLNKVLALEKVEQFIRNIGKQFDCLTISFTQAGDSASNKLILDMNDVDFSNTGMQASADVMVGIGMDHQHEQLNQRVLSFPKNKRPNGNKDPVRVNVNFRLNRYT